MSTVNLFCLAYLIQDPCSYAGDRKYSSADIQKFVTDPDYFLRYRKTLEGETNMVSIGTPVHKMIC